MGFNYNTAERTSAARAQVKAGHRPTWYSDRFVNVDWVDGTGKKICRLGTIGLKLTDAAHAKLIAKLDSLDEGKQIELISKLLAKNIQVSYNSVEKEERDGPIDLLDEF